MKPERPAVTDIGGDRNQFGAVEKLKRFLFAPHVDGQKRPAAV